MSHQEVSLSIGAFFVILSQIPKQTFDLDNSFHIPHLWYFFVNIVDNFVHNYVFRVFFTLFLGDNFPFFPQVTFFHFTGRHFSVGAFVQFAQKTSCQYRFEFFLFSLFSKNSPRKLIRFPILQRHEGISFLRQLFQDVRKHLCRQITARRIV